MRTERQPGPEMVQTNDTPFTIEVQVYQAKQDCWHYAWDHDLQRLRVVGKEPGHTNLPANLALLALTEQATIPVYVLADPGLMPKTVLHVRVLGALQVPSRQEGEPAAFPLDGWTLIAVPDLSDFPPCGSTLEQLPPDVLATFIKPKSVSSNHQEKRRFFRLLDQSMPARQEGAYGSESHFSKQRGAGGDCRR